MSFIRAELLHSLLFLCAESLSLKYCGLGWGFLVVFIIFLRCIFFCETIDKDGQEEIQQDEITDKNPTDIVNGTDSLENPWTLRSSHRDIEYLLPIFHGQHLEHSDESYWERFIVCSGQILTRLNHVLTLEDLTTQEGVDEDEHEHQDCDHDKVWESTLDNTNDCCHRSEST